LPISPKTLDPFFQTASIVVPALAQPELGPRTFAAGEGKAFTALYFLQCMSLEFSRRDISPFRCAAEFGRRYRGIADSGKPNALQIYGFTT
jgi:hypothetical protein